MSEINLTSAQTDEIAVAATEAGLPGVWDGSRILAFIAFLQKIWPIIAPFLLPLIVPVTPPTPPGPTV
jgi:hypothetical protein